MISPLRILARTPEDTRAVAGALAPLLAPGDVVSLSGDLGAGKTTFVQGAAAALEVEEPVLSPTFVLVRQYLGSLPLLHVDVYRLGTMQEVLDLGFEEFLDEGWVVFVEWGDVIDSLFPPAYLEVELGLGDGDERQITLVGRGRSWAERWERLEQALVAWQGEG